MTYRALRLSSNKWEGPSYFIPEEKKMDSPRSFIQIKPYRGTNSDFQQTRSDRRIKKEDSINKTREERLFNKQFDSLVRSYKQRDGERGASEEGIFWVWDARLTSVFILFLIYLGAASFLEKTSKPLSFIVCFELLNKGESKGRGPFLLDR